MTPENTQHLDSYPWCVKKDVKMIQRTMQMKKCHHWEQIQTPSLFYTLDCTELRLNVLLYLNTLQNKLCLRKDWKYKVTLNDVL